MTSADIEHIDQLLNELEQQALSTEMPSPRLFAHILQRVCFLLQAEAAAIVLPAANSFLVVAQHGTLTEAILNQCVTQASSAIAKSPSAVSGVCENKYWFAVPLRPGNFAKGCLIACLNKAPPATTADSICELLVAFAEIVALRQMGELEGFLDQRWEKVQSLCTHLGRLQEPTGANAIVDQLIPIFSASRVSLATANRWRSIRLSAISGVPQFDARSESALSLLKLAKTCIHTGKASIRQQSQIAEPQDITSSSHPVEQDGTFANCVCLPLLTTEPSIATNNCLVIEWTDYATMVHALAIVPHVVPTLSVAWEHYSRWRRVPKWIQVWSQWRWSSQAWLWPVVRWAILIFLLYGIYRGLMMPYPLTIEAEGSIEPTVMRTVFASMDGYMDQLLVDDGQTVQADQPLVRLSSPDLEVRLEEVQGEMRTLYEKRSALQIASNQLNADAADFLVTQNRMASEIKQLMTQLENLKLQLKILQSEKQKLVIPSPIQGVIVAKDLKQHLTSRPVRRGDALFRVVDLQGPWHLRIQVPDRDSGYVLKGFRSTDEANALKAVKFVLDSQPEEQFDSEVTWIADTVQNLHAEGCFVEMRAEVSKDVVERVHMGASARTFFQCGEQPLWFVWCRPLVEAIQRRFWFWSSS
jgi:multidrug efflux pump subunit AcrA (membrane-fusion protein)